MSNLNSKFKKILKDIEENIENKDDLEYIKIQIFNLYNLFFEELNKIEEATTERISTIVRTQAELQKKVENLENKIKSMEKELYIDEEDDFSIICPYCNNEFIVDYDELKNEVECPKCNNIIELEWGEEHNRM
ncbi:MAG: hypothetical protein Q4G09_02575 [Clostridia bacterium]|nr:hypothetical protein [Clostridia bacterium]